MGIAELDTGFDWKCFNQLRLVSGSLRRTSSLENLTVNQPLASSESISDEDFPLDSISRKHAFSHYAHSARKLTHLQLIQ